MLAVGCLGDGLVLGGDRLSAIDRNADLRLRRLVETALGTTGAPIAQSIAVQRAGRLPLMIRTLRLQEQGGLMEQDPGSLRSPGLLVLVLDPELWPEPRHEMLAQAFGLTPAEADVAIGIASGRTLAQIAVDRHVKIGTVRAHLKTVFSKTHTHGQADLTRVLTRLAFLTPQAEPKTILARSA
jgi:DNA-binding CsgD family transcriptional regulator